jgi:hypothetical protein
MGEVTGFAALLKNVPSTFKKEFSGGPGMHIHDKFVVVDFNGSNPTVFTGSSNLAAGGETQNGDSLTMIEDASVATIYAIEAVALFDHYHFRKKVAAATKPYDLTLWFPTIPGRPVPWWKPYYDPSRVEMRDRLLFAKQPLPAGMTSVKEVDWKALDATEAKPAQKQKKSEGAASRAKPAARKSSARTATTKKTVKKAAAARPKRKAAKSTSAKTASKKAASKKAARPAKKRARSK